MAPSPCKIVTIILTHSIILAKGLSSIAPRGSCAHLESPFSFWNIFQEPARRNETHQTGPYCLQVPPYCAENLNNFTLSQGANAAHQHDLVTSYVYGPADPSCGSQETTGPYTLEFAYDPNDVKIATGANTRIDVFDINGDLPQRFDGHREYYSVPNWNNIGPLTGALVGSFEVPTGKKGKVVQVVKGVQKVCRMQYNWRLSFTNSNPGAGSIQYTQVNVTGLRFKHGC